MTAVSTDTITILLFQLLDTILIHLDLGHRAANISTAVLLHQLSWPSTVRPSMVRPSTVRPSTVRPSTVRSTVMHT